MPKAKQNEQGVSGGRVAWGGELEPELGEEEVRVWGGFSSEHQSLGWGWGAGEEGFWMESGPAWSMRAQME